MVNEIPEILRQNYHLLLLLAQLLDCSSDKKFKDNARLLKKTAKKVL